MTSSTRLYLALALLALGREPVRAEPPAAHEAQPQPQSQVPTQKHVRQVGGERGPKVEITPAAPQRARAARAAAWRVLKHDLKAPSELPAAVREELRVHARRMARLQRVQLLAVQAHDQATMQRADQLLAREQARHRAQLARAWPAPLPSVQPRKAVAPPRDDDQDDDRPGERETEDEEDPQEGQP
jgi:hypothetical protein